MDWKAAMVDLARLGGGENPPLFAPLARAVASQIEAISPLEMMLDPTRLAKGIGELKRAAGLDMFVTATPCGMEAQALGGTVDCNVWPPRISCGSQTDFDTEMDFDEAWERGEMLRSAIEATERLAQADDVGAAIVAALTGPSTLLRQLAGEEEPTDDARDFVAAALAALARRFGQAGADVIAMIEQSPLVEDWTDLYGTIGNNAKFLKKPLIVGLDVESADWPRLATPRNAVLTLAATPESWTNAEMPTTARIVTTLGEIPAETPLAALFDHIGDARRQLGL